MGFGITYRGFQISATVNADWTVTIEAGVGNGQAGISMPVLIISGKDFSFAFVPDFNPALKVALGKYQSLKWSPKDGFGREIGAEFPLIKGKVIFNVSADLPKAVATSPATTSTLMFEKDGLKVTPWTSPAPSQPALSQTQPWEWPRGPLFDLGTIKPVQSNRPLSPHVFRFATAMLMPDKGYTWLDGSTTFRTEGASLEVKWSPGQASVIPAHVHASTAEGFWEPDAGYQWDDGSRQRLSTLQSLFRSAVWTPGLPCPDHANVISSRTEGQWQPAPGFTWLTDDVNDLRVCPQLVN
jgi:hypothetical protein